MLRLTKRLLLASAVLVGTSWQTVSLRAADDVHAARTKAIQDGINYLKSSQADDGSWTTTKTVGITGLVTTALLESGVPASDPSVQKALKHLKSFVQEDGGIYVPKSTHRNYETAISLMAFASADKKEYKSIIANATKFLKG
ncbi:MAG: terpene cyclase/mutase family protein, partial [Planctomycetaceae bacterium]|nr:terpene cyclase/mutase family protein [Planctomycetaceae bacterium]